MFLVLVTLGENLPPNWTVYVRLSCQSHSPNKNVHSLRSGDILHLTSLKRAPAGLSSPFNYASLSELGRTFPRKPEMASSVCAFVRSGEGAFGTTWLRRLRASGMRVLMHRECLCMFFTHSNRREDMQSPFPAKPWLCEEGMEIHR